MTKKFVQSFGSEKSRLFLKGSAGSLFLRVCGVGLRFVSGVILARILGASAYGQFALAVTWMTVLAIPAMLGLDHILIRYISTYVENKQWASLRGLLRFSWRTGVGFSVFIAFASSLFIVMRREGTSDLGLTLLLTFAVIPAIVVNQIQQAMLRGFQRPALAQIPEQIFYPGTLLLLLISVWAFSGRLTTPIAACINGTSWLIALLFGVFWVRQNVPSPVRHSPVESQKPLWTSMMPDLFFFNLAYQVMSRTPTLALGILGTSRDVGIYSVCTRGAEFAEFIYGAVTLAGAPLFATLFARGDRAELQRFVSVMARTILGASLPFFLLLFYIVPWFLSFYGREFTGGAGIMRWLLSVFFLNSLCGFVDVMLIVSGFQRSVAKVMGLMAVLNIGLCWILIPSLGLWGAALASGITVLSLKMTLGWLVFKKIGIVSFPIDPRRLFRLIPGLTLAS